MEPKTIFAANQVLTLEVAKTLIGKKISCTSPEYHANTPTVQEFTLAAIISEYDYCLTQPCNGFSSRSAYWESYMKQDALLHTQKTLRLIDSNGIPHYNCHTDYYFFGPTKTFSGSDADREITPQLEPVKMWDEIFNKLEMIDPHNK
jgi:hypothetical protein